MVAWLAGTLSQVAAFWLPTSHPAAVPSVFVPSASGLMTVAAIALTAMIVAFLARGGQIAAVITARPLTGRAAALRRKSWSAAFQRQRNPDAAGRARPRAPSVALAAA